MLPEALLKLRDGATLIMSVALTTDVLFEEFSLFRRGRWRRGGQCENGCRRESEIRQTLHYLRMVVNSAELQFYRLTRFSNVMRQDKTQVQGPDPSPEPRIERSANGPLILALTAASR